jgi:hypothetical protein
MGISVIGGAAAAAKIQKVEDFTATTSWTCPADVTRVEIIAYGGGGAGGTTSSTSRSGEGGHGSAFEGIITVSPGTTYTVTIGAGGAQNNAASAAGANGSDSTFGALFTATGGQGGHTSVESVRMPGGSGGRGGVADDTVTGSSIKVYASHGLYGRGGGGGAGTYNGAVHGKDGGGQNYYQLATNDQWAGKANYGAGGSAGFTAKIGGAGGSGYIKIKYWSAL